MNTELLQGFYLGDFYIEPLKGQVVGNGATAHLPPKAAEVLLCLASHPGELVSREDLIECVWGDGHGSGELLSHAVSEIRHALGDHADDPRFVQTLPRRGYRLVVDPVVDHNHTDSVVIGTQGGSQEISFFESLSRRGVLETALAYLVLGWLIIQVADIVFDQLHLPEWTGTFVTSLVIAGFPIALILSWFLEFRDGRATLEVRAPRDERRRRFSRTYISIVCSLVLAAFLVFLFDRQYGLPTEEPQAPVVQASSQPRLPPIVENSIAVLPFMNLDGSEQTQIFANGLMEDVITQLSRVPGLRVASRGDSATMAPNSTSQAVRQRLRVERYLEGSVEMNSDEMRVTVQLIDSEDGFHILSRRFDRPRRDFFEVRDEITGLTVANVRVALPNGLQVSSLRLADDPSLDAYVLYRRGVDASRQPASIDAISSALGWFDAALAVDPEYAAAHAGKCSVFVDGYSEFDDSSYVALAESACAKALSTSPNLDIVHTALGDLYQLTGRIHDAELEYLQALATDPSNAESLTGLGQIYARQNRLDEAEASLRQAVESHPGNWQTYNKLGFFFFQLGRFEEAAEQFQYVAGLVPDEQQGHTNLGTAYMMMGDFEAAAPAFQRAIDIRPITIAYSNLGLMQYYLGNLDAAIESHSNAVDLQPGDHLARSNLGDALWVAGRYDEARLEFENAEQLAENATSVNPNDPYTMMDLAWISANIDKDDKARALMDKALKLAPDDPYTHYYNALVLVRTGDTKAALAAVTTAVQHGYSRKMIAADPQLQVLREEPRFRATIADN